MYEDFIGPDGESIILFRVHKIGCECEKCEEGRWEKLDRELLGISHHEQEEDNQ